MPFIIVAIKATEVADALLFSSLLLIFTAVARFRRVFEKTTHRQFCVTSFAYVY